MLSGYDADPVSALATAVGKLLDRPGAPWPELVAAAEFSPARRAALLTGDPAALDTLVAELNELRALPTFEG